LCKILVDPRHDWPTNGAALALLQYSHSALSNQAFYFKLEEHKVFELACKFLNVCSNKETKRHLYEMVSLLNITRNKMQSIGQVLSENRFASAA